MKERIKNVLNFKKPSRIIITLAVALVAVLSVDFAVNRASDNSIDESKLLTRLGYSKEIVSNVIDNRTTFSDDNKHISQIVNFLPLQADRKYISFSIEKGQTKEINIVYEYDENNYYRGGNGLDPFPETVRENNALLLFASVGELEKVNFLHYDYSQTLNRVDSYTMDDLTTRFGEIMPLQMGFADLYNSLAANVQLSEFYFAHYSRIYLDATFEDVAYRNNEPNEVIQQADGSIIWIYRELGKSYTLFPSSDDWKIDNPGYTALYYFNNPLAEKNDNLTALYTTMIYENDGESYDNLTAYLGYPDNIKDMGSGNTYIAYSLREGQQRNAYFILRNNKVIAQGVTYGNDCEILNFAETPDLAAVQKRPTLALYGYDANTDNGDADEVKKHFTGKLQPEADTGWTILTDMIFIEVQIPNGTVAVQTYYAEAGSETTAHIMFDGKYSSPQKSLFTDTRGNTWRATDYFPDGFLGHIWAVVTDSAGVEHYSEIMNVAYPRPGYDVNGDPLFSAQEVAAAKAVVEKYFKAWAEKDEDEWWATWGKEKPENAASFGDWTITLKDIRYNPQDLMRESYVTNGGGSVNNTSTENVIVFKCDFNVHSPDSISTIAFNEGDYTNWSVILVRQNAGAEWFVADNGY